MRASQIIGTFGALVLQMGLDAEYSRVWHLGLSIVLISIVWILADIRNDG